MPLTLLPLLDTSSMASARKQELLLTPGEAKSSAVSALSASVAGAHELPDGTRVRWNRQLRYALEAKKSLPPDAPLPPCPVQRFQETAVQISNETTLEAAGRLLDTGHRPLALNFANGLQPGGGFLDGGCAQEEALCRASALYMTLQSDPMYSAHRRNPLPAASDWCILSPDVPVFKTDRGTWLREPRILSFLSCAAPDASAIGLEMSARLLRRRIHRVLAIAAAFRYASLVLGAWGCGAFGNNPRQTAMDFYDALTGEFEGKFRHVTFAVADWTPVRRYLGPFQQVFSMPVPPRKRRMQFECIP